MDIIHHAIAAPTVGRPRVTIEVERRTLAKRRWRGVAGDGREFGFDLEHALHDGDAVFASDESVYVIAQKPEAVLELQISDCGLRLEEIARLGWMIGNLHFPLAIDAGVLRTVDDPALRQLFEREHIAFTSCERVFRPLSGGHSHSHEGHHH